MRCFKKPSLFCLLLLTVQLNGQETIRSTVLYQVSTYGSFKEGAFGGVVSLRELRSHGDMGLGTFHGADGEMIALDGKFYYIDLNGTALPADDNANIPFAQVAYLGNPRIVRIESSTNYGALKSRIERLITNKNAFYAIQVSGSFQSLKLRSLPKQKEPYSVLDSVVAYQKVTNLEQVEGTIVGFRSPAGVGDLSANGIHAHFISKDRTKGGHVLEIATDSAMTMKIQEIGKYEIVFLLEE